MNRNTSNFKFPVLLLLAVMFVIAGCSKKPVPPPQTPPPPPAAPTASISASPNNVEKGQQTQLTWRSENATDVSIDGIGPVQPNGSRMVTPDQSTSYRLVAKGPGGEQSATARVTVTMPPPPPIAEQPVSQTDEQWFTQNIKDVYFDYDSAAIRADAQQAIQANAQALAQRASFRVLIEGHCDERGSTEYNLALGDERARAVKNALVAAGVNASRINTTSFGKEKPACTEANEACWQQNRRGHFVLTGK
ncbi:MAG TPA: peptidoglycan-associated lipoprotein Pal [Terriglobales bacterium]|nr:peptidoglycan-associated lipoprotein Pal [Terriglobales bacterium]